MIRTRFFPGRWSETSAASAMIAALIVGCSSSSGDDGGGGDDAGSGVDTSAPSPDSGAHKGNDAGSHPSDAGMQTDNDAGSSPPPNDSSVGTGPEDSGSGPPTLPPDAGTTGPSGTPTSLLITVTNLCPVDVWSHGAAQEGVLLPDNVHLVPGASQQYYGPQTWTAGRIYAYLQAPDGNGNPQGQNDKIEMNFGATSGGISTNTDITYVDWVALPSKVEAIGSGSDCTTVGCGLPYSQILNGCPPSLLTGHECLSAGSYCLDNPNSNDPFCSALDSQIAACAANDQGCAQAAGETTTEAYSCSGTFFGSNNEFCAAVNRGVVANPAATTPPSDFYVNPPFNEYAAWVHKTCPGIYAFPYDDFGNTNQSSDHTCAPATELRITWCPQG